WSDPWRLNLRSPPSRAAPDVDVEAGGHAAGAPEQSEGPAPMPGAVGRGLVEPRGTGSARPPPVGPRSMEMETPPLPPYQAAVRAVHVGEGDRVAGGAVLVELDE